MQNSIPSSKKLLITRQMACLSGSANPFGACLCHKTVAQAEDRVYVISYQNMALIVTQRRLSPINIVDIEDIHHQL